MKKPTRWLWNVIGTVAIGSSLLFVVGFGYAIKSVIYPTASGIINTPLPSMGAPDDGDYMILALGDSLTKGTGDQSSKGYIQHVTDAMKEMTEQPVRMVNFAINGYRTTQLLRDITGQTGIEAAIKQANLITFTIGGNDIFSIGDEVDVEDSRGKLPETLDNINQIFFHLVELNPQALIYYIALYNPFIELDNGEESSLFVQELNYEIFKLANAFPTIHVIPTYDLFQTNTMNYLSSDRYHPNQVGYERIAARIVQTLE